MMLLQLLPGMKDRLNRKSLKKQSKMQGESCNTLETTLSSTRWDRDDSEASPARPRPHRRSGALMEEDFDKLFVQSRGWQYDPSEPPSQPKHDRGRNKALSYYDFDHYIFRPTAPRLGYQ